MEAEKGQERLLELKAADKLDETTALSTGTEETEAFESACRLMTPELTLTPETQSLLLEGEAGPTVLY